MPVTTTVKETLKAALNEANLNKLADVLARMDLGTMLTPKKVALTGLTGATHNITDAAHGSNPAILAVVALRVTAASTGTAVGTYGVTDAGGAVVSPATSTAMGIAKLSDDGTTLTFATADVTAFVIEYIPRSAVDMNGAFTRE
jgi:hypothetical protein